MFVENVATGQSIVMTHVTAAGLSVAVIQWLKNSPYFPWITAERDRLLRGIAILTAAIGAVGVTWTWHPDARELIFKIPTLAVFFGMLAAWVKSFVMQELVYRATVKNGSSQPPAAGSSNPALAPGKVLAPVIAIVAVLLGAGCAVRHLPNGATAPATKWEQLMAWNAALAQTNDGLADNVISLQKNGTISKDAAHIILFKQGSIAQADKRITANLQAAALCGSTNAAPGATPAQLSDASGACAKTYGQALDRDFSLVLTTVAELNSQKLLGLSDQERGAIGPELMALANLVHDIVGVLQHYGASAGASSAVQ
jgi:hypothetical protein